jgi:hypothetical protein
MQTFSHLLMTAFIGDRLQKREIAVHSRSALLGSLAPDASLYVLTFGYWGYRALFDPIQPGEGPFGPRYDALFFGDPFWIISHNLFHAPLVIIFLAVLGYQAMRRQRSWGGPLFWFALACGLHSFIDILTHHNDGPLLLFPFNWSYRWVSPVSYWDPAHYGTIFAPLELLFNLAIIGYLLVAWWQRRSQHREQLRLRADNDPG